MVVALATIMGACDGVSYDYPLHYNVVNDTDEEMLYCVATVSATVLNGRFYDWYLPDTLSGMKRLPPKTAVEETSDMSVKWFRHTDTDGMVVLFYRPSTIASHTRRELIDSVIFDQAQFANRRNLHFDRSVHYTGRGPGADTLFVKKPWREVE